MALTSLHETSDYGLTPSPPRLPAAGYRSPGAAAAYVEFSSALDSTPLLTRAFVLPMMVTSAAVIDLTSAVASSSLTMSRHLVDRAIKAFGWD